MTQKKKSGLPGNREASKMDWVLRTPFLNFHVGSCFV